MEASIDGGLQGAAAPTQAAAPAQTEGVLGVVVRGLGFVAFGTACALGLDTGFAVHADYTAINPWLVGLNTVVAVLVAPVGALLMTSPALLVLHPYLHLAAAPRTWLSRIAHGWGDAGAVAWGLTPLTLFYAATTSLSVVFLLLGSVGIAVLSLGLTARRLVQAEREAGATLPQAGMALALAGGWALTALLISIRIGADLLVHPLFS